MKKTLATCGLLIFFFQGINAAEVAPKQERTETTVTCSELEGAANWGVTILEDKSLSKFWAQIKYEVVEYECDDVSDGSSVGMKCNQTGGLVNISSPKISFDSCEVKSAKDVNCKSNNSTIAVKGNSLKFKFDMNGENGVQLTELFNSVTEISKDQSRSVGISNCLIKRTKI